MAGAPAAGGATPASADEILATRTAYAWEHEAFDIPDDLVARGGRIGASGHGRPHDARHHGDETIDTDPTDTPTQGALA